MIMKLKKRTNWKRGSSELIGFAIILPVMMMLLMGILSITQLALTRIAVEQAAYIGCRTAVVRSDLSTAQNAAEQAVKMRLGQGTYGISQDDITVTLEPVAGITDTSTGSTPEWVKGTMVQMTIDVAVDPPLSFLGTMHMQTNICMMVEQPVRDLGGTP